MAATAGDLSGPVYDSAERSSAVGSVVRNLWRRRALIRVLVARDQASRYRRSILGIGWVLVTPLALAGVMWLVFANAFELPVGDDVPYVVYVLSGVVVAGTVAQGLVSAGGAIAANAALVRRLDVPGEVLAVAAALGVAVPFLASTAALLLVQLLAGAGIAATAIFLPLVGVALLCGIAGLGLFVAALAVRFSDMMEMVRIGVTLLTYLTPVFYPIAIVPDRVRWVIEVNPVYHAVLIFRGLAYEGRLAPWWAFAGLFAAVTSSLALGLWTYGRSRRALALMV